MNANDIDDLLQHIKKANRQIKSHRGEEHISGVEGRADTRGEKALVLALVLEIWDAYPDQRLGQLLSNVEGSLFQLEDQELCTRLSRQFKSYIDEVIEEKDANIKSFKQKHFDS